VRRTFNTIWFGLALGLAIVTGVILWNQKDRQLVYLDTAPIFVDVAADKEARTKGLSGQENLEHGRGMLFVLDDEQTGCMWMKQMNFSIDVYWYSKSKELINHRENISPDSYPAIFCPDIPAAYMLEVNVGQFDLAPDRLTLTDNL
jgi:uncharacterized membrane protein (UPF0127 family)